MRRQTVFDILNELVTLSRRIADPANDYVILAEGNTSAAVDGATFYVKASGHTLVDIAESGFVRVRRAPCLEMLERESMTDDEIKDGLLKVRVNPLNPTRPSVETLFHAYLLSLPGVSVIAHTHPTPVNAILCSRDWDLAFSGRLFPDEIVCCGPAPVLVPYVDPGQPLAREIKARVESYMTEHNLVPKVILMQNHGLIAIGKNAQEVESATAMSVKTARVLLGTRAFGGPSYLTQANVDRIHTRPDEKFREAQLGGATGPSSFGPGGQRQPVQSRMG